MSARTFFLGLLLTFGLPWLVLLGLPYGSLKAIQPTALDEDGLVFPPPARGMMEFGQQVYLAQGCYQCHTQVVRPTYAGPDRWRFSGETPRETQPLDFLHGGTIAPLGLQRIGPDLANVGTRIDDPAWHYLHLYEPRAVHPWSVMPAYKNLFEKRRIQGQGAADALSLPDLEAGWEVVPATEAKALVTYLLALRMDAPTEAPATE